MARFPIYLPAHLLIYWSEQVTVICPIESKYPTHADPSRITVSSLRQQISQELHNRPSPQVNAPTSIAHMAVRLTEKQRDQEYQQLYSLCERYNVNPPSIEASCYYQDFGGFELRWERHLEFSSYSFIRKGLGKQLFDGYAIEYVPQEWFDNIVGELVSAVNLVISQDKLLEQELYHAFEGHQVLGSNVADNRAKVYASFRLHSDGFGRIIIQSNMLNSYQAGRLIQRMLEIETYQMMALLSLPMARSLSPKVAKMELDLVEINQKMAGFCKGNDSGMLDELSYLAGKTEQLISDISYRFSATNAYYELVCSRLEQLKETDIEGIERINEFVTRRLSPGIRTCQALSIRLEKLTLRIARASSLLRTRVDLTIEQQNQQLLSAINQRGEVQLRLQQMVEGVSIAAMAYYLIGLLDYMLDAVNLSGFHLNKILIKGFAAPIILCLTWLLLRFAMSYIKKIPVKVSK
ncbi:DUF3422 domain-containing protein [Colwellia demingiae]|uniref:DUF3422 domain-containing protein n=1 Tax=Colwellia demingiae TaxID=89401 RepID=A0A5C6Q437_9GAMM|nr:DUF3422 domain-containing protein [Colwellia demingiae]TWX63634.1 DUF3422 domain-containing protein [Colwellia demingiae]